MDIKYNRKLRELILVSKRSDGCIDFTLMCATCCAFGRSKFKIPSSIRKRENKFIKKIKKKFKNLKMEIFIRVQSKFLTISI